MDGTRVLVQGRIVGSVGTRPVRKRTAKKPLTARRALRLFRRGVKFVLLVTWEVTKLLVRIAWELFLMYLYAFLKIASFVMRATM